MKVPIIIAAFLFGIGVSGFTVVSPNRQKNLAPSSSIVQQAPPPVRLSPLFMGRAAAVRAATKSKTDAKKAKTNAVFGKRIIMAVKQGGSPDPESNRLLHDVIKQAKTNSVPVEVSNGDDILCFVLDGFIGRLTTLTLFLMLAYRYK